jgi:adenylosuccinate lyase
LDKDETSIFDLFSPADYRYSVRELIPYLSEEAYVQYKSKVEAALAKILAKRGAISESSAEEIRKASEQIKARDVYDEESRTGHDVIAQVNLIKKRVSDEAKTGVHRTATSYDIIDSANTMRYRDAFNKIILPDMVELERVWIDSARKWSDVLQIGRTHLQHAEPITFGFAMAWYVSRLGKEIVKINDAVKSLDGKFSGAVGAYNASSLFVENPEEFEREILAELGLSPSEISTQIIQPEPLTDLIHHTISSFTILSNWADDMRNLQRSEIEEIGQPRGKDISRSSTMPHKANPVGLENIKSLWKATVPYMFMMHLDQISDHQRDLTNSASQRYIPQILNQFDYSVRRAVRISKNLQPNVQNMLKNFNSGADKAIAEPLHLLLSAYGHPNSHEYVGNLADESSLTGIPLRDMVLKDASLKPYLEKFTAKQMNIIENPSKYVGIAAEKAKSIADRWSERMTELERGRN